MASNTNEPIEISESTKRIPENLWIRQADLCTKYKPVNLGEGFPNFGEAVSGRLKNYLIATQGPDSPTSNFQYSRSQGNPLLVKELADVYSVIMGRKIDAMDEVMISVGADESLHCIVNGIVNPGEEVIIIEPCYVNFVGFVRSCGGIPRFVPLRMKPGGVSGNDFVFDEDELKAAFNEKTKAIIMNTPHNPTGKVFNRKEITFIADLCKQHNCLYISDEVYEWMLYDDVESVRAASLPGMWERTVTVGSAGKSFSVTGWKVGWTIGPKYLVAAATKIHASILYCVATPLQVALADMFREEKKLMGTKESYWYWLVQMLKVKRDRIFKILTEAGFRPFMPQGGYFIMADASGLGINPYPESEVKELDQRMVEWMIVEKGISAIPVTAFVCADRKLEFDKFIRFCFIRSDETMDAAEQKLKLLKEPSKL